MLKMLLYYLDLWSFNDSQTCQKLLTGLCDVKPQHKETNEPQHMISNNVVYSDPSVQPPFFSLETPNDVR